jgi:signal transduction histidine kinase
MTTAGEASEGDDAAQSGLALAVAHEFIRRMDGDLWAESDGVTGAVISFRLPALE